MLRALVQFHLLDSFESPVVIPWSHRRWRCDRRGRGRPDLFRVRLDQMINMKHELVQLAGRVNWTGTDGEIARLYSGKGRPGNATRFCSGCCSHSRSVR